MFKAGAGTPGLPRLFTLFLIFAALRPASPGAQSSLSINRDRVETVAGQGLLVRTKPAGALVYINGIERGRTPLALEDLRGGSYLLRLAKTGYREREARIFIAEGNRLELDFELEELAGRVLVTIRRGQGPGGEAAPFKGEPFKPELFVDGEPPLDAEIFPDSSSWAWPGNPGAPRIFEPRRPYRGRRNRRPGDTPGAAYLISVVPVSASRWVYELHVPAGFRTIRVRAFGWNEVYASLLVEPDRTARLDMELSPAAFLLSGGRLSRPVFNPENTGELGSTSLSFEVSGPGSGTFSVLDQEGSQVYSRRIPPFETWSQRVSWNGRNDRGEPLGEGSYTLCVEAFPSSAEDPAPAGQSIRRQARIDPSLLIYPLSLSAAMPGLLYAPSPALLPPRSFQLESSLLLGMIPSAGVSGAPGNTFSGAGLPFELAFRFSPLKRLELAAALGNPALKEENFWGFSASAKWLFIGPGGWNLAGRNLPLQAALMGAFSWAPRAERTPQREGASLIVPLAWDFGSGFSLFAGPGLFWPGWKQGEPRLLLSLGPYFRRGMFSAGLSLRAEFELIREGLGGPLGEGPGAGPGAPPVLFSAAELKLFPPVSNLVVTALGGFWNRGAAWGGFGGLALGAIF
jgi:hypothetical protein